MTSISNKAAMQILIARGEVPGVPAAGHIERGYWHPGARRNCQKCPSKTV